MRVRTIAWVGTRTDDPEAMVDLLREVLGIPLDHGDGGMWALRLPDGSKVEVFGPDSDNAHFTTGPVPGFLVDDVDAATEELRSAGVPIVSGPTHMEGEGLAWVHFRAPDGNIYELTQDRDFV
jgi:catechol 2,3-dioxygenase-like lactoylglutathione lyase family enzyme